MASGRGDCKTYERVQYLLQKAIKAKGQSVVEKETGLSHSMISRYKRGTGEPTTATLEKLADYFKVSVGWLRGDDDLVITWGKLLGAGHIGRISTIYGLLRPGDPYEGFPLEGDDDLSPQDFFNVTPESVSREVDDIVDIIEGILDLEKLFRADGFVSITRSNIRLSLSAYSYWLAEKICEHINFVENIITKKDKDRLEKACGVLMDTVLDPEYIFKNDGSNLSKNDSN